ncbi:MAG: hypothetical protein CVV51_11630, partial [Spirochaetae bacterium HGW-Spirochaetae-7]
MKAMVIGALLTSFIACLSLGTIGLFQARAKGRFYSFPALCASAAVYAVFAAAELLQPSLGGVLFCIAFEYAGMVSVAVAMFFVIRDFSGAERPTPGLVAKVSIIPVMTVVIAGTIPYHELLYKAPSIATVSGLSIISFGKGPWYWVNVVYIYGIFLYGLVVFLKAARFGSVSRRRQVALMLAGSIAPILANIIYMAGLNPAGIDITPIAFTVSAAFYSAGFFKYRLFDIQPLARDLVFEQMRDAAVVVDDSGEIIDHNKAAETLFEELAEGSGDLSIEAIIASHARKNLSVACDDTGTTISIPGSTGADRRFETHCSAVRSTNGNLLGEIHTFIDVTERELLQEKLEELASTDELTRLPNRRRFYELAAVELERARRHARPVGLAVMDMNGFKEINDRYGHQAGDEALRLTARLCVDTLR